MLILYSVFSLFLVYGCVAEELKASDYHCANSYVSLQCSQDHVIFVTSSEHVYRSGQCYDDEVDYETGPSQSHCIGYDETCDYYKSRCNGLQDCHVKVEKRQHQKGVFGGNCNFESNIAKVFYSCVPKEMNDKIPSFDICHDSPRDLSELNEAFIHSPNYPYYYQNSKDCQINIRTRQQRLVIYMLRLNMEGKGLFSRQPNDFLQIQGGEKLHGKEVPPQIVYNGTERKVVLHFETDWGTSTYLDFPKGFLLYFKLDSMPTTTTSTTVTTKTTTTTSTTTKNTTGVPYYGEIKKEIVYIKSDTQQGLGSDREHGYSSAIATLVSIIGLLIVVIFGLLLLFRRQQPQFNDEENVYDSSKTEYQNVSISQQQTSPVGKFNAKVMKLYKSMSDTIQHSTSVLNRSAPVITDSTPVKITYSANEVKQEKNTPNSGAEQSNENNKSVRVENEYVTLPTLDESASAYVSMPTVDEETDPKLKIYEINLDKAGSEITISPNEKQEKPLGNRDTEIYSSINDIEAYSRLEKDSKQLIAAKSQKENDVYSTPSNARVLKPANTETPINVQNYSHMQLLEDDDSEEDVKV